MSPEKRYIKKVLIDSPNTRCLLDGTRMEISGNLRIVDSGNFVRVVTRQTGDLKLSRLVINIDNVNEIDSAGVIALFHIIEFLSKKGCDVNLEGGKNTVQEKLKLFKPVKVVKRRIHERQGLLERTGQKASEFITSYIYEFFVLAANIFYWALHDLFIPRTSRRGEFVNQSVNIGVNAAFIIIIMSFAIGLVLALHSARELRNFGADIYIVDLTVIAMMSQMGPLITAIMVSGRSGSAIAAEIASMKVSSELDALNTMGLNPLRFVVVPKLYACMFTMPFLIILANVSGITGGALAAYTSLNITPEIFINRMGSVMYNKDLLTGLIKSQVYAGIIVLTGSFYGFSVDRGAEGVGRVTTESVVTSISLVVIADSIMGLLFY
jgi:phospholipid/cholesterol/gamma-HCH transport system permease protein